MAALAFRFPSRQRGMTLLELLVVMTLLALIGSLLMQGFGNALSLYERVQRRQLDSIPLELGYGWFAATLAGTQAELDPPRQFRGDGRSLEGVTHRPLLGLPGQVSFFAWRLEEGIGGRLQLTYSQPGQLQWVIATWPAGSQGQFVYRSLQGGPAERWPEAAEQTDGQIPGAILLQITPPGEPPLRWYANLPGRTFPRLDYRDL
ncbi:hypothetical protein AvCA_16120 [Azotobacter vinelandii CA]|uniref:Prepilin-type N-terminal cleavage/methylation domain-containing protein n=2 Tax=Azotobacter vinelandii TaxID=354 RepID=C1DRT9_AZOVD|nr:type II secretion system protein [Azotobacter vinelandii]ACO77827.1 hypothetical protein Avin_16120 [Azotobacter vinelandii DJ]AGK16968.1 hypothetical protein AvCA_16120 [Azotobacter vinelandii CA]AGK20003.1 hypothetical protein AvCA6_16120 [Azotobacter vinelandii CA6]SFX86554.1 general secretion pathway protein J [Azotobacter vinelandii]GLK62502.1 hypothetical protein GCM10017624_46680 [Azotobacter vinelandii]